MADERQIVLLIAMIVAATTSARAGPTGNVVDRGRTDGYHTNAGPAPLDLIGCAINDRGDVVAATVAGGSKAFSKRPVLIEGATRVTTPIPPSAGQPLGTPDSTGSHGDVAGMSVTANLNRAGTGRVVIHDLGTLGGSFSEGRAINNAGQVTGHAYTASDAADHGFRYDGAPGSNGVMKDLGVIDGWLSSAGNDVNASGQVAGSVDSISWEYAMVAFRYDGTPGADGVLRALGASSQAAGGAGMGINDAGQVTGFAWVFEGRRHPILQAFRYDGTPGIDGVRHDLGAPAGLSDSVGRAINNAGQVVGYAAHEDTPAEFRAFRYDGTPGIDGGWHDLGNLGGSWSDAYAINDSGQVTGVASTAGGAAHAFRYDGTPGIDGMMHDLGVLAGMNDSIGKAINTGGFIVGASMSDEESAAVLWRPDGSIVNLDAWLDQEDSAFGSLWTLTVANDINDKGLITGVGYYDDGVSRGHRAYILDASGVGVAIPLPAPALSAAAGLIGVGIAQGITDFVRRDPSGRRETISSEGEQPYSILINDRNHVVGATTAGEGREYHVTPFRLNEFGEKTPLAEAPLVAFVQGVNDSGDVAAGTWDGPIPYSWDHRAMLVRADGSHDLIATLGGKNNDALAINDAGVMVGSSELADFATHGFYTDATGRPVDIGTLGGASSVATDINDAGIIVGSSATVSRETHAFLKPPGEPMIDLTPLADNSAATRINGMGQVLVTIEEVQYLYDEGLLYALAELFDPLESEWDRLSFRATALNDRGEIVGVGTMAGRDHGFLLTPVSSTVVPLPLPLLSGLAGLLVVYAPVLYRGLSRGRSRDASGVGHATST